jgi:hypothetical protein
MSCLAFGTIASQSMTTTMMLFVLCLTHIAFLIGYFDVSRVVVYSITLRVPPLSRQSPISRHTISCGLSIAAFGTLYYNNVRICIWNTDGHLAKSKHCIFHLVLEQLAYYRLPEQEFSDSTRSILGASLLPACLHERFRTICQIFPEWWRNFRHERCFPAILQEIWLFRVTSMLSY